MVLVVFGLTLTFIKEANKVAGSWIQAQNNSFFRLRNGHSNSKMRMLVCLVGKAQLMRSLNALSLAAAPSAFDIGRPLEWWIERWCQAVSIYQVAECSVVHK